MIIKLLNRIATLYRRTVSSIGFWPTLITLMFGVLAIGLLYLVPQGTNQFMLEKVPGLVIKDGDTARVILSTVIGGMVSLTVFSFTMVMAQLNRAATNYSPRLLPGLISTTRHQVILGLFLGTITFTLLVLLNIEPSTSAYELPGLAILVGVTLALLCLAVFVFFIHSISQVIQVGNILQRVADSTSRRLTELDGWESRHREGKENEVDCPHAIRSKVTGYFQGCNEDALLTIAKKHDLTIHVLPLQGEFVLENTIPVRVSKEGDEEIRDEIFSCLRFGADRLASENYVLGCKQICEIAVRAMSPGMNDPGTALAAIDHLTQVLALRMRLDDRETHCEDSGTLRLEVAAVSFADLLYLLHASLRLYTKHDIVIVLKLLQMFDYLLQQPVDKQSHHDVVLVEMATLLQDAEESVQNDRDKQRFRDYADEIKARNERSPKS